MASSGKEKFEKYFKGKEISTFVKGKANQQVKITNEKGIVIDTIYANTPITVPAVKDFSSKYKILYKKNNKQTIGYIHESFVSKPIDTSKGGATELLGIQSNTLITLGKKDIFEYNGMKISGYSFTTASQLANSILANLRKNPKVNRDNSGILSVLENYFKSSDPKKITWNKEVLPSEINELGKYLGELLLGYIILKSPSSYPVIKGTPKYFFIPDDPSFKGVDTFIKTTTGLYPVSNKFGVGAKASFFGNLLPIALEKYQYLPSNSTIKKIADITKKLNISSADLLRNKGAKNIVYEYGTRVILGIPATKVKNTYDVYTNIKTSVASKNLTKESSTVIDAIKSIKNLETNIKINLPKSITAFFNRQIAAELNSDSKSLNFMLDVLAGKEFYQANLNIDRWKKGEIIYSLTKSGDVSINIIGSKSAISDIDAKQGLINYELKIK